MPNLDGTGPNGQGPLTGRGMGKCEGAQPGAGRGMGRGQGRGMRQYLSVEEQEKFLTERLDAIRKLKKDNA